MLRLNRNCTGLIVCMSRFSHLGVLTVTVSDNFCLSLPCWPVKITIFEPMLVKKLAMVVANFNFIAAILVANLNLCLLGGFKPFLT